MEERNEDIFETTFGNLKVLETIPHMMIEPSWRKKLRKLVFEYLIKDDYTLEKNKNPVYLEKLSKQTGGNK